MNDKLKYLEKKLRRIERDLIESQRARLRLEKLTDSNYYQFTKLIEELAEKTKQTLRTLEHLNEEKAKVEAANKKIQKLSEQRIAFFRQISHELRTPLTLMTIPLKREYEKSPTNSNIRSAYNNTNRLHRLVNQLLDYQKIEAGELQVQYQAINLIDFLEICSEDFSNACREKETLFRCTVQGKDLKLCDKQSIDLFINADLDYLEKIIFNFLSNALKFTPSNGYIELGVIYDNHKVNLFVSDTGPGIPKAALKNLFKPFFQLGSTISRAYEGTGIGLTLSKQLTEAMGAEIEITTEPNIGSRFGITFDRYYTEKGAVSTQFRVKEWLIERNSSFSLRQERTIIPSPDPHHLIRVLLVDDSIEIIDLIKTMLESRGLFVASAINGKQALEAFEKINPQIVISDWVMPELNGLDLLKLIKKEKPETFFALLTAKTEKSSLIHALNQGADRFFTKPFQSNEFLDMMNDFVARALEAEYPKVTSLDWLDALKRNDGQLTLYLKALTIFRKNYTGSLAEIVQFHKDQDYDKTLDYIHKFKGACGHISAIKLYELICKLESQLKAKQSDNHLWNVSQGYLEKVINDIKLMEQNIQK